MVPPGVATNWHGLLALLFSLNAWKSGTVFIPLAFGFTGGLIVLMVMALFQKPRGREHQFKTGFSIAGWAIGFVLPGAGRQWGLFGPLVTTAFFAAMQIAYFFARSQGMAANPLEAIGFPGMAHAYGLFDYFLAPREALIADLRHLWWILLLINLIFMIVMECVRPDPLGARGKAAPQSPVNPD